MNQAVIYKAVLKDGTEFTFPEGEVPEVGAEYFINGKYHIVTSVGDDGTVEMEESRRQVLSPSKPAELKPIEIPVPAEASSSSSEHNASLTR